MRADFLPLRVFRIGPQILLPAYPSLAGFFISMHWLLVHVASVFFLPRAGLPICS